jgi:ferredoxin--NADP+ reductase
VTEPADSYDLIVIGGTPAGLSLAAEAQASGLQRVLVLERSDTVRPRDGAGRLGLQVRFQAKIESIELLDGGVQVLTETGPLVGAAVAIAEVASGLSRAPEYEVPPSLASRVSDHTKSVPNEAVDVLVVGGGESGVSACVALVDRGYRVVLAHSGEPEQLSRLSQEMLHDLERERLATILWRSRPAGIDDLEGFPMVYFRDRRTPDLQFDYVVMALGIAGDGISFEEMGVNVAPGSDRVFVLKGQLTLLGETPGQVIPAENAWESVRLAVFPSLTATPRQLPASVKGELAGRFYNATITYFEKAHSDLWLIRIRPDHGNADFRAGQYATLGLGYWEPRVDDAIDALKEGQVQKLVRRSYSIRSPVLNDIGYLVNPYEAQELEFYIVLVPPSVGRTPSLTPRLALKEVGDRIYLGPKVSGRYTLASVDDPGSTVVFLSTGTGEAPHNAMVAELMRRGHHGAIVSVVSVRKWSDLGYYQTHLELERRYPNYHYLPFPTREEDVPKKYIQDILSDGDLDALLGEPLDPARANIFLCGNPAMIGPPSWEGDVPSFPAVIGAVEVLHSLGFVSDRRGAEGNVHFEEYW